MKTYKVVLVPKPDAPKPGGPSTTLDHMEFTFTVGTNDKRDNAAERISRGVLKDLGLLDYMDFTLTEITGDAEAL